MPYISPAGSDSLQRFNLLEENALFGLVFIVTITPYPYQMALLVQDTTQEQLHNHSVCSTAVNHQVKPTVTYRLHQHHSPSRLFC